MFHSRALYRSGLIALLLMVFSATVALGQSSSVSGVISDPQGKVVSGAKVTLTNAATGISREVISTGDGSWQAVQMQPGTYRIRVEAQGFASLVREDVQLLVNTPLTLNLAFTQIGAVSETVTIQGGESALNTSDATIGNTFNNTQVVELPLNARNVVGLLSLQPGVTASGEVNGGRSDQANVTLDGVDVNEQQGGRAFFSVLRSTPDSLQEFRVTTTNPNANQGRSSGAQVALVTKSGTNDFHGSLYEFHRNTVTSANDWFNNKSGVKRPAILRNNFGGSIGGPILKDKLFFFFNYEGFREARGTSVVRQVPLPTLGQGIVRYYSSDGSSDPTCPAGTPSGVICLTTAKINAAYTAANGVTPGINPAALSALAAAASRYPANSTDLGDLLNTAAFRFNAGTPSSNNTYIGKFDYNLTDKQSVFVRLNYQNDTTSGISRFPDTPVPTNWVHPKGIAVGHTWALSNAIVNTFRYGLTRDSFTLGGDSNQNFVSFRFVFQPLTFSRGLSRTTPVHNIVDDLSWTKGNHNIQVGTNIRLIKNNRVSFGSAFDNASTNPSFYDFSGDVVITDEANGDDIFAKVGSRSRIDLRDALTAVIGRFSQYGVNLNYGADGKILSSGQGIGRTFATEEYEAYGQDSWRISPNLTVNYGVRWSTSTPVYEANGVQVKPTPGLSEFFDKRVAGAKAGTPYNGLISVDLAGKVNNRDGYYSQDWNNFAPMASIAWSPNFKNGMLKKVFGENKSTFRGGYRMTFDRIGSALAVAFDLNSTLGFGSAQTIAANTYNVGTNLAPQFTAFGQNIRSLPGINFASSLKFPLQTPADEDQRIEASLDDRLVTPYNHSYNFSIGRELGKGYSFEVSYVGRLARNLLMTRDVAHLNNLVDSKSGVDWYTAIRQLITLREKNTPITSVGNIPYFQNLFPGLAGNFSVLGTTTALTATQSAYRRVARSAVGGRNTTDYTFVQLLWDDGLGFGNNLFFHPQYATFATASTLGTSDYHSLQWSLRKRFSKSLTFDFNYTWSHSLDTASFTEQSGSITGVEVLNPLNLNENRGNSDFDVRHLINANFLYELPFGKGKTFFGNAGKVANAILGGWKLTGIVRHNTGFPIGDPFDDGRWSTNWNVQSNGRQLTSTQATPTRSGDPNLFSNPQGAYTSYRNSLPGEWGDRNVLRGPNFFQIDTGLYKSFGLWKENTKLTFRWETFNLTNTQAFTGIANFRLAQDPFAGGTAPTDFGKFTGIQGTPRVMQFALRLEF
ncbi:MAG: carboxypeptidase regulatory-like domain-containing protein [Acidobacteria bacterium]|nr:carboxypeptidase regulatory-like domain-containing protein [Acidobacteriota bacterium]